MNYTNREIDLIEYATMDAYVAIDSAYSLILDFMETYLESEDAIRTLIYDAETRTGILSAHVRAIYTMIREAKTELDAFSSENSVVLNRSIEIAAELKAIRDRRRIKETA